MNRGGRFAARAICVFCAAVLWSIAAASSPSAAGDLSETDSSATVLYKTATYQGLSSLNDFLYGTMFAGGAAMGGGLAAASLVTEPIVYYAHEAIWTGIAAGGHISDAALIPMKTASYVTANMGRSFATGWLLTGDPHIAAAYMAINAVGDSVVYALNESAWASYLSRE